MDTGLTQDMVGMCIDNADLQMLQELMEGHVVNYMEPIRAAGSICSATPFREGMLVSWNGLHNSLKAMHIRGLGMPRLRVKPHLM